MGNRQSTPCQNCGKNLKRFQTGKACIICKRPFCEKCSTREKMVVKEKKKPKSMRVCHSCLVSMENIENKIGEGGEE